MVANGYSRPYATPNKICIAIQKSTNGVLYNADVYHESADIFSSVFLIVWT